MKLKSLILGSVAAAGLSTAGFAADLGVLTSLDVCDSLGLSGLTISSDTNCLQISGGVAYEFRFGDYRAADDIVLTPIGNDYNLPTFGSPDFIGPDSDPVTGESNDWQTKVTAWLKFVGTASSDFGPAKAVLTLKQVEAVRYRNAVRDAWGDNEPLHIDEAYVSIGDTTTIMAGRKSSIAFFGDSQPLNFLGTFGYSGVDNGVMFDNDDELDVLGGHVIQVTSDVGNGVKVGVGLENLDGLDDSGLQDTAPSRTGSLVGIVSYAGENITAHLTGFGIGVLDGEIDEWGAHAGVTGRFDAFRVTAAAGYYHNDILDLDKFHGLVSGAATFDMFTLALTGEYQRSDFAGLVNDGYGIAGSVGANVTEGVSINLGARYFSADFEDAPVTGPFAGVAENEALQVAAQLIFAVTETLKLTGEIGGYFSEDTLPLVTADADDNVYYGAARLDWSPSTDFTSGVQAEIYSNEAYRLTVRAQKTFE
jgi:hypothetical protein